MSKDLTSEINGFNEDIGDLLTVIGKLIENSTNGDQQLLAGLNNVRNRIVGLQRRYNGLVGDIVAASRQG